MIDVHLHAESQREIENAKREGERKCSHREWPQLPSCIWALAEGGEGEWPPAKRLKVKCREQLKAKWVKPSKSKLRRRRRLHRYMKEQPELAKSRAVSGEKWRGVPRGFPFQLSFSVAQSMRAMQGAKQLASPQNVSVALSLPLSLPLSLSISLSLFLSLSLPLLLLNWFAFLVSQIWYQFSYHFNSYALQIWFTFIACASRGLQKESVKPPINATVYVCVYVCVCLCIF